MVAMYVAIRARFQQGALPGGTIRQHGVWPEAGTELMYRNNTRFRPQLPNMIGDPAFIAGAYF